MNLFNPRTNGLLIAALLLLGFGTFLALATDFGNNWDNEPDSDDLSAIAASTTSTFETLPTTTSTTFALTATTFPVPTTFSVTPTTKKPTTATTRRVTTTTARPRATTTTVPAPHPGVGQETSDNTGSFTHNAGDTYTGSAVGACAASDPFCFNLGAGAGTGEVTIIAELRNHTSKPISFPGGLKITVTVQNPGGTSTQFVMDASSATSIAPGELLRLTSQTAFAENGQFTFDATCQVDYGS